MPTEIIEVRCFRPRGPKLASSFVCTDPLRRPSLSAIANKVFKGSGDQKMASILLPKTPEGKTLLLRRTSTTYNGQGCAAGGKVDLNETPFQAAVREFEEETGRRLKFEEVYPTALLRIKDGPNPNLLVVAFMAQVSAPFIPDLGDKKEHDDYIWDMPQALFANKEIKLTPALRQLLQHPVMQRNFS